MSDPERLCLHTMTTRPWGLEEALREYRAAGIPALTVWRNALEGIDLPAAAALIRDSGLRVASLCRGGFFPSARPAARQAAIDDNRLAIDQAAALGAPLVVLVCGADPDQSLEESRRQIADGIHAVLPHAAAAGVRLAIEPLHPMYAGDRSAINTLRQANEMAEAINHPNLGITVDVYHLWWDPDLQAGIQRAGPRIFSFHVCDWRNPTRDLLNDRTLMGRGCIPIRQIRQWVDAAGFAGWIEVEIFSTELWQGDQRQFLAAVLAAYRDHC